MKYAAADNETSKSTSTPTVTPRITATFDGLDVEAGGDVVGAADAAAGGVRNFGGKSAPGVLELGEMTAGRVFGGGEGGSLGVDGVGLGAGTCPGTAESGLAASLLSARTCPLNPAKFEQSEAKALEGTIVRSRRKMTGRTLCPVGTAIIAYCDIESVLETHRSKYNFID